jgi:ABC-type molybdate transport system permease subunit
MKKLIIFIIVLAVIGIAVYFYFKNKKGGSLFSNTVTVPTVLPDGTIGTKEVPAPTKAEIESAKKATHGKG